MTENLDTEYLSRASMRADEESPTARLLKARRQARGDTSITLTAPAPEPSSERKPAQVGLPGQPEPSFVSPEGETARSMEALGAAQASAGGVPSGGIAGGEEGRPFLPTLGEALKQIPGGVLQSFQNVLQIPQELHAWKQRNTAAWIDEAVTAGAVTPEQATQIKTARDPLADLLAALGRRVPQIGQPESIGGGFIRGAAAFLTPFLPAFKAAGAIPKVEQLVQSASTGARLAGMGIKSGVAGIPADIIAFEPGDPRLSNLVQQLPEPFRNPVTEFLAAPELEPGEELAMEQRFVERVKNAAEGLALGATLGTSIDALVLGVKAVRRSSRLRKEEK
jgi:hypothetical protein